MVKGFKQDAENLRLLLLAGIVSVEDVVAWADRLLVSLPEYDDDVAAVSLAAGESVHHVIPLLCRLSNGADTVESIRNLAGRMHRILLKDRSKARDFAEMLVALGVEFAFDFPEDLAFIVRIDDMLDLAESGIFGTIERTTDDLIAWTSRFDLDEGNA